jgi:DNA-binding MarR family transcriptional regulator
VAPPSTKRLAWLRSFEAHTYLVELMDADLRRDCGVPLALYDVLIKLWHAADHRLRMADLADQVLLSRSWLTRRVVQLEAAGLVTRVGSGDDGRGVLAAMTPDGIERFRQLERSHAESIRRRFSAHMSAEEATVVAEVFARIAAEARHDLAATGERPVRRSRRAPVGA